MCVVLISVWVATFMQCWNPSVLQTSKLHHKFSPVGWVLDKSSIFAQVDAFIQRCKDLLEVGALLRSSFTRFQRKNGLSSGWYFIKGSVIFKPSLWSWLWCILTIVLTMLQLYLNYYFDVPVYLLISDTLSLQIYCTRLSTVGCHTFFVFSPSTWNDLPLPFWKNPFLDSLESNLRTCLFLNSRPAMFSASHC